MNSLSTSVWGSLPSTAVSIAVLLRLWRSDRHSPSAYVWALSDWLSTFAEDRQRGVVRKQAMDAGGLRSPPGSVSFGTMR
jgi:hypothetical protein